MKISCIDIGGTYIKSGVLEDGVLTGVEETPTDGGGGARAMLSRVAQMCIRDSHKYGYCGYRIADRIRGRFQLYPKIQSALWRHAWKVQRTAPKQILYMLLTEYVKTKHRSR